MVKKFKSSFFAASIGLLANALYIDVFASSKVAFTYWALAGAILAINYQQAHEPQAKKIKVKSKK